jgi:hypothetical protein
MDKNIKNTNLGPHIHERFHDEEPSWVETRNSLHNKRMLNQQDWAIYGEDVVLKVKA